MSKENPRTTYLMVGIFFLFHLVTIIFIAKAAPFPTDLDEIQHFSYVYHVKENPSLLPDYRDMRIVDLKNPGSFTDKKNHLAHPSFYYLALSFLADPKGASLADNVSRLRLANIFISALAMGLFLVLGFKMFRDPSSLFIYVMILTLCPKVGVLGGMINNDNAALLGAAIAATGLYRFLNGPMTAATAALIGAGFAIAALSKLTAGVMIGLWLLFCHLAEIKRFLRQYRTAAIYLLVLATFGAAGLFPHIAGVLESGSPVRLDQFSDPGLLGRDAGALVYLDFTAYLRRFVLLFVLSWATFSPDPGDYLVLATVLTLGVFGIWYGTSRQPFKDTPASVKLALSGLAAFVCTLVINFIFSYTLHLNTGHLGGMQFRYYLPLWVVFAAGAAYAMNAFATESRKGVIILFLMGLLLYSHTVPLVADILSGLIESRT